MKYRKKPVVVEAFKWGGATEPEWFVTAIKMGDIVVYRPRMLEGKPYAKIKTSEGAETVNIGDYIIKGVKGEIYSCKSDIFEINYEEFEEEEEIE